ncbi:MAG: acyl-CoA/acyl-ACP dehydrogenase [Candidatus Rokubacteria bacterium]|nr:acyl-CoA/acyl-ACP dehydrogenase [Candidatus Rokubacteria bacterium]
MSDDLRRLLADTCTRLFTDRVTPALIESAEKGEWPDALWQAVEENGLTLPQIPEARGGAGGSWDDAHVVLTATGRFAVPLPIAETMAGAWLLASAGLDVPLGPLTVAPTQLQDRLVLRREGSGWRLSGTAARVPWGRDARHVVVLAESGGKPMVALVARGTARLERDTNLALEPRDTLTWSETTPVAVGAADALPADSLWYAGALVRAAQMAGGLEFLLSQSVKYVSERKQFGRPLSAFQAIQHNLALLAGHTAVAGMAAQTACHAMERGDAAFEIAAAKIRVGEAAGLGAGIAHQAHGAIGFTYEHSLHFVTRRLWSWRAEFGGEGHWAERLGREVAARGADALWPTLTAR